MSNKGFKHTLESRQKISKSLLGNTRSLGYVHSAETLEKRSKALMGNQHTKGHTLTTEHRQKVSEALKGKPAWNKGKKQSLETRRKISAGGKGLKRSTETRQRMSGASNHNWKGGTTPTNTKGRQSYEYRAWITAVLHRDNYTCQVCDQYGGDMHVDHIKPYATHPELRNELTNGRTLCRPCHYYVTFKRAMPATSKWGLKKARIAS